METPIEGVGLGLRYSFAEEVPQKEEIPRWFEIAPENWMRRGGFFRRTLERIRERSPIVCHGLSLSIGSPDPLNIEFLKDIKRFLDDFEIEVYSEHISFSSLGGNYLHDLLPLPFTEETVKRVAKKVKEVEEILERPLILENISYYLRLPGEMEEWEFINAVLRESGARLLLDVNNVYVNSLNHGYDPYKFIENLDLSRTAYIHIAGHERFERVVIDTHGAPVIEDVYKLLEFTLDRTGPVPLLLERDNNIPPYEELLKEVRRLEEVWSVRGTG